VLDFIGRFVPALRLRASPEEEVLGIDDVEIGEFAYDYVELSRDVKPGMTIDAESHHSTEENYIPGESSMPGEHPEKSYDSSRPLRFVDA
jgi:ammonium transporter, Amt family